MTNPTAPNTTPAETPPPLAWDESLALGYPGVDQQHRRIFDLAAALLSDDNRGRVMSSIAELSNYTVVHFRDEELLLTKVDYPHRERHIEAHNNFRKRLARLCQEAAVKSLNEVAADVRALVNDWLRQHILVEDRAFVAFLSERRG